MTTTTDARPRWIRTIATAVATVVVAGMVHVLSSEVTWWKVLMFALAAALVASATFVALRNLRVVVAVVVAAVVVYASRCFLASGFINVLDVGLLLADDVLAPLISTWIATFVLASAMVFALEAKRKIWFIALVAVIAAVTIPTRFPDLV